MKQTFLLSIILGLLLSISCAPVTLSPRQPAPSPATVSEQQVPNQATVTPSRTPTFAPPPASANPGFERIVNLGLPVGNATSPRHLALDSAEGLLYILSNGIPLLEQGNGVTIYDLSTGQFTAHTKLSGQHNPLDLQVDATNDLLYVLREGQFGAEIPFNVTVLNSQTLAVIQELPNVKTMVATPGQLYTANLTELGRYQVRGGVLLPQGQVSLPTTTSVSRLLVNPTTNRLYLARQDAGGWGLDVYTADTLTPLKSFVTKDQILTLLLDQSSQEVLVVENQGGQRVIHRITAEGEFVASPYLLDQRYDRHDLALSADSRALYVSSSTIPDPQATDSFETLSGLVRFDTAHFSPGQTILLPAAFEDITLDDTRNQAFALSSFENLLYVIDLTAATAQSIPTALEIQDIVVDEADGELFVSDSSGYVRRLAPDFSLLDAGSSQAAGARRLPPDAGQLALDLTRNRLYVSGEPAVVLAADTLEPLTRLSPGGQFALVPGGDTVFLSNCGVTRLEANQLTIQGTLPNSTPRDDQLVPNPCVATSRLDGANQRLYGLAPNGVPGSNSGNLLYIYDLAPRPTLIFSGTMLSAVQAIPDPARQRVFVRYTQPGNNHGMLRTLSATATTIRFEHQLQGVLGQTLYNPATNHLHFSDGTRLLTLAADSLDLVGELPLPPGYDYRLVGLNPQSGQLYLAGHDGQLLIARDGAGATTAANLSALATAGFPLPQGTAPPAGRILDLLSLTNGDILARIETRQTDFQTDTRLFSTADGGQTWRDLSQNLQAHQPLQAVAVSPDQSIVVAHQGGIYLSQDGGQAWTLAGKGLRDLVVTRLDVPAHMDKDLIFANTLHAGLHYSPDSGQSWQPLATLDPNTSLPPNAHHLATGSGGVILATLPDEAGLPKLQRATLQPSGRLSAWQGPVLDSIPSLLAFAPDGQTVLAYGNTLWRSTDGGQRWEPGGQGLVDLDQLAAEKFLFSPNFATNQTAYLFFQDISGAASARLFRSTDGGQSWQVWDNPPGSKRFTTATFAPDGDLLFGDVQAQITRLDPANFLWAKPTLPANPFPWDDLVASSAFAQDKTVFALSHQHGLFKSVDGGQQWQELPFPVRSISSLETYQLVLSPTYREDQTLFIATGFSLHRSTDGGQSWQNLQPALKRSSFEIKQVSLSPAYEIDQTILVASPDAVLRSGDGGDTWEQVLQRPAEAGGPRLLAFSPSSGAAYLWFDYGSTLFISKDGGQQWQAQSGLPLEPFPVVTAAVGPGDVLVLRPDFYPQFFQLRNQGQIRQPLTEVLPPNFGAVQSLAYTADGTLWAGGTGGLLRSFNDGEIWQSLNAGLPLKANVTHIRPTRRHLLIGLADGAILSSADDGASWQEIAVVK